MANEIRLYDTPRSGIYEDKDGVLRDILTHEEIKSLRFRTPMPLHGYFQRNDASLVDYRDLMGSGGSGGVIVINDKHFFQNETERDQYFIDSPSELKDHMYIAVAGGFQIYIESTDAWEDITSIVEGPKGDKGDTGDKGDDGAQGPQGPQGEPGQDGSDSMPEPPNDGKRYSRVWDNATEQYIWDHDNEVQQPFIQDFTGDPYITLPETPGIIMDIWIMSSIANPRMLLSTDYTVSGKTITPINPIFGEGMTIKVVYTA